MRGQKTRGRAGSAGTCRTPRGTPPYSAHRQQRPDSKPDIAEGPVPEADRVLSISELFRRLPAPMMSRPGVTTHVIDGYVIQESLQPFSSTTAATTTSVVGAQRYYRVSSTDAPPSTTPYPGTEPGRLPRTESPPVAATSTVYLTPERKTPSLAREKPEEVPQTTPIKTASSVPGAAATAKSKVVKGTPPEVPSTSPRDSAASQASPALLTTPRQRQQQPTCPLQSGSNSPENWTVEDVAEYVAGIPGCERFAEKFRHHEIDGGALFLIKEHHLMTTMNMKLGPALKMCATIGSLREES
ncbi:hypothetical protein MTO96_032276 [Rhipicephalus appendiculatus]